MEIKPWHIISVGLLFFLYIVAPLFSSGYLLNQDQPAQYLRMLCLSEQGVAPNNWCPYINAGTPTSQYYYPVVDQAVALLGKLFGLLIVYKIFLVLALLIPALGIWIWLKDRHPMGAAIGFVTYLFYTAGWHAGGFMETIIVGFASNMWSIGFLFIALYYYNKFLEGRELGSINTIKAIVATLFILHPLTLILAVVCYIGITLVHWKNLKEISGNIVCFIIFSLGINAFYIAPLIAKLKYFPTGSNGYITWEMFMGYIWNPMSAAFLGMPIFFILAAVGIFWVCTKRETKEYPLIALTVAVTLYTMFNFIINPVVNQFTIGIRLGAFLGPLIIILACLGIDYIYSKNNKLVVLIGVIIMLVFLFISIVAVRDYVSMSDTQTESLYKYVDYTASEGGRVLMETIPGTHMQSLLPILTGREIIGFGTTIYPKDFNLIDVTGPTLFATPIEQWDREALQVIFELYNIKYLFIYSPNYQNYFDKYLNYTTIEPFKLYDTGIKPSYIFGNVTDVKYEGTKASAYVINPGVVALKVNYYPEWTTKLNGEYTTTTQCAPSLVCAMANSSGKIEFEYKLTVVDKIGYIITIGTLVLMFSCYACVRKK